MNRTTDGFQIQYAKRFLMTAAAIVGAAVSVQLISLGRTGDHSSLVTLTAVICICICWFGARDLHRRWVQLRQLHVVHEHGPYDRREYIPPQEATRQFGNDDGPNMWR
jgi:hypothetical protein